MCLSCFICKAFIWCKRYLIYSLFLTLDQVSSILIKLIFFLFFLFSHHADAMFEDDDEDEEDGFLPGYDM